jgi:hypothetical protein
MILSQRIYLETDIDLFVEGNPIRRRTPEGTYELPRTGVDAIALDANGEWLYYGALNGTSLYRVRTKDLRNTQLSSEELTARVEGYTEKPIFNGILIDTAGNIYLGELAANAIGVGSPYKQVQVTPSTTFWNRNKSANISNLIDYLLTPFSSLESFLYIFFET